MSANIDAEPTAEPVSPPRTQVRVLNIGPRVLATLLDAVVVLFISMILAVIVGMVFGILNVYSRNEDIPVDAIVVVTSLVVSILYYVAAWQRTGQTLGHVVVGGRVVGRDGKPVSWGQALLRYVGFILSALVFSIGFLWVAFDKKRQGWHDKMARTYVAVSDDPMPRAGEIEWVPRDSTPGWAWLLVWVAFAVLFPPALVGGLLALGPFVAGAVSSFIWNLL